MEIRENVFDASAEFARRGQQPSRPKLWDAKVVGRIEPELVFLPEEALHIVRSLDDAEVMQCVQEGLSREELIDEAVQAVFDYYDEVMMGEYSGLPDQEREELEKRKEACLSVLTDEEKDIAMVRFRETITSSKPHSPEAS